MKAELKGVIRGVGIDKVGEVRQHPELLSMTYEVGKNV